MKKAGILICTGLQSSREKAPVKKDLIKKEGCNTVLVCPDKGQDIPSHPEPYDAVFLVLEGKGVITSGNSRYDVKPGHLVSVERNKDRGIRCIARMTILGIQQLHLAAKERNIP